MSNVDTVKDIYAAFGRGDVPAILEKLDENVEWDTETDVPGVPWLTPRRGRANVPAFFESLAPLEITRFEPHTFFESGDRVFALIALEASHKGQKLLDPQRRPPLAVQPRRESGKVPPHRGHAGAPAYGARGVSASPGTRRR